MSLGLTASKAERFECFVQAHRDDAIRLAWRLLGSHRSAAEDVAQQAFMKAWDHLDRFRDEASVKTWFNRILVNQVRSYQRWALVRHRARWFLGIPAAVAPTERDRGLGERLSNALETLSAGQREAFTLVHLEGLTVREAAAVLNRAPGTIKSHLHRSLVTLREELRDVWEGRT